MGREDELPDEESEDDRDGENDEGSLDDHESLAHLDSFLFDGQTSGVTQPGESTFHLGQHESEQWMVHLHEGAHRQLLDESEWGAVLTFLHAGGAPFREDYLDHLRATVLTHEGWATFVAVLLTERSGRPVRELLPVRYAQHLRRLEQLLVPIRGTSRRYFASWAVARACSRSPVLRRFPTSADGAHALAGTRAIDRPDTRLRLLAALTEDDVGAIGAAADEAFARITGRHPVDESDLDASDDAWDAWERAFEELLCTRLRAHGAEVVAATDYLADAVRAQSRLPASHPARALRIASGDVVPTDDEWLGGWLRPLLFRITPSARPGRFGILGTSISAGELIDLVARTTTVGGIPELTLHLRLARRLREGWAWDDQSDHRLADAGDPVMCIRVPLWNEDDEREDVLHVAVPDLVDVLEEWGHRGPVTAVIAASALLGRCADAWVRASTSIADVVVLADVGALNLTTGPHALIAPDKPITVRAMHVSGTGFSALGWVNEGSAAACIVVADGATVDLLEDRVRSTHAVEPRDDVWQRWTPAIHRALRSLLSTESAFDLRGAISEG